MSPFNLREYNNINQPEQQINEFNQYFQNNPLYLNNYNYVPNINAESFVPKNKRISQQSNSYVQHSRKINDSSNNQFNNVNQNTSTKNINTNNKTQFNINHSYSNNNYYNNNINFVVINQNSTPLTNTTTNSTTTITSTIPTSIPNSTTFPNPNASPPKKQTSTHEVSTLNVPKHCLSTSLPTKVSTNLPSNLLPTNLLPLNILSNLSSVKQFKPKFNKDNDVFTSPNITSATTEPEFLHYNSSSSEGKEFDFSSYLSKDHTDLKNLNNVSYFNDFTTCFENKVNVKDTKDKKNIKDISQLFANSSYFTKPIVTTNVSNTNILFNFKVAYMS